MNPHIKRRLYDSVVTFTDTKYIAAVQLERDVKPDDERIKMIVEFLDSLPRRRVK